MQWPFSTVRPRNRAGAFVLAVAIGLVPAGPALAESLPSDTAALDALSLFISGSHEAVQRFGGLGETLSDVRAGQFVGAGTGATKRTLSQGWNETIAKWRGASAATKQSLPFTFAPHAMLASDALTAVIAPASGGDLRGATSGAVNLAVAGSAVSGGAAAFSALGAGVGATLGSFVPVVGTAAGGIVGGAIGTVAGGFVSATAYELYVKGLVASSIEGGIAAVFDVDPLSEAMRAREQHLRMQAALDLQPEWDRLHIMSETFDFGGVELVGPPRIGYVPGAPEAAAIPPETGDIDYLAGVSRLEIAGNYIWTIKDGAATFHAEFPGATTVVMDGRGTVSGNRISGTMQWVATNTDGRCGFVTRHRQDFVEIYGPDTVEGVFQPGPLEVLSTTGPCESVFAKTVDGWTYTVPWRKLD